MTKPEFIARQGRCPSGLLGHIVARIMAHETYSENGRLLSLLRLKDTDDVLEIGFGHGETLRRTARLARNGRLAGIDFSDVSLTHARRRNRDLIAAGRLDLRKGDSRELPFADASFDKVFAVHTIYFWTDPAHHLAEAHRVLRSGGRFAIAYRSCANKRAVETFPQTVYRFPSVGGVEETLRGLGLVHTRTITEDVGDRLTHWTIAEKPG